MRLCGGAQPTTVEMMPVGGDIDVEVPETLGLTTPYRETTKKTSET